MIINSGPTLIFFFFFNTPIPFIVFTCLEYLQVNFTHHVILQQAFTLSMDFCHYKLHQESLCIYFKYRLFYFCRMDFQSGFARLKTVDIFNFMDRFLPPNSRVYLLNAYIQLYQFHCNHMRAGLYLTPLGISGPQHQTWQNEANVIFFSYFLFVCLFFCVFCFPVSFFQKTPQKSFKENEISSYVTLSKVHSMLLRLFFAPREDNVEYYI